jgi:hypothetical protein
LERFVFAPNARMLDEASTRVLEVPPTGLSDKRALLDWYAQALDLPDYFGGNWDALEECLRDLSWINERSVVLYHRAVPLESSPHDQKVYVQVLASAAEAWGPGDAHELVVAFNPRCRLKLRSLSGGR